jgi:hypothetical protein
MRKEIETGFKVLDEKLLGQGNGLGCGEWVFMGDA